MTPAAEYEFFRDITSGSLALRHGTLLVATAYQALWRDLPLPSSCHHHSALTIRYINSSLESIDGQAADGTLAAIACLVAFEVFLSLPEHELRLHTLLTPTECCQPCHDFKCSPCGHGGPDGSPWCLSAWLCWLSY